MNSVRDCQSFHRLWNQRLDNRMGESSAMTRALADHASGCESCRALGSIYADFEHIPASWPAIAPPSDPVIERWQAAAASARKAPQRSVFRQAASRGSSWVIAAATIASALIGARASLPILFSIEPAPKAHYSPSDSLFLLEEAFAEASTMTQELAREVSAPAAQMSSRGLGWPERATLPDFLFRPIDLPGSSTTCDHETNLTTHSQTIDLVEAEGISGSARHAFRFLVGSGSDIWEEPEKVGGF